ELEAVRDVRLQTHEQESRRVFVRDVAFDRLLGIGQLAVRTPAPQDPVALDDLPRLVGVTTALVSRIRATHVRRDRTSVAVRMLALLEHRALRHLVVLVAIAEQDLARGDRVVRRRRDLVAQRLPADHRLRETIREAERLALEPLRAPLRPDRITAARFHAPPL